MKHARLALILAVALTVRLAVGLSQDALTPYDRLSGGDSWWYLEYSYRQVTDTQMEPPSTAPIYLLVVGGLRWLFYVPAAVAIPLLAPPGGGLDIVSVAGQPTAGAVIALRVIQALADTLTCAFLYRIARALWQTESAGLIAAGIGALSVTLIVGTAEIATEALFLCFFSGGMAAYLEALTPDQTRRFATRRLLLAGIGFGLATLTRAAALLFPLGIVAHAGVVWWRNRARPTGVHVTGIFGLLAVYVLLCGLWTGFYYARWGEWVIGAKGMSAFFFLGTQDDVPDPEQIDAALGATPANPANEGAYLETASRVIGADLRGYLSLRARNLLSTVLQPHGTVAFPGDSLRVMAAQWLAEDLTAGGLTALTRTAGFWPKLAIYIWHFGGILFGAAGAVILLWRTRWRETLPPLGWIAYLLLLHLLLLALPRYLFPMMIGWWPLAAGVFSRRRVRASATGH
ncbi:MAG: ArnT family glycosyltransferase [Phototrophicaceae bacterium]